MDKSNKWEEELEIIRSIIQDIGLKVEIKWGNEVYTHLNRNVVSYGGFKDFFTLWFYDGVFLKDSKNKLINANEAKTKALRQWRFYSKEDIDEKLIKSYILEAIQNVEDGKIWKPERDSKIVLPELMQTYFAKDKQLKAAFGKLTLFKQKEFIEYIDTAKREDTKISRMEKIAPMIHDGIGLHDKYRN